MDICIVGLGSIGTRHLYNLCHILEERRTAYAVDALRSTDSPMTSETTRMIRREYFSYDDLPDSYDIAIISNPSSLHYNTLRQMAQKAHHVFVEKPVFDHAGYDLKELQLKEDSVYYVACPLRYHSVTSYLKPIADSEKIYSARVICSSYLPEWRSGIDYRKCYSAKKEMGGGVRIDLVHEWDYLWYLFGTPTCTNEMFGTFSSLEITSEDLAVYIANYPDKLVSIHLDYFGRFKKREIELYTEEDVIVGDFISSQVRFLKSKECIDLPQSRNEVQKMELVNFFDMVDGKIANHNDIPTAMHVLNIALGGIKP